MTTSAEAARLAAADSGAAPWRAWGPYVSERAWGTVREDYTADSSAWDSFPHDHARSRAYRWSEDGMAAVCDTAQTFVLALALWNGRDAILKERIFGLTGPEGNRGEDAHEFFDGYTGRGLGASHQTGWTALVADLVLTAGGRRDSQGGNR